MRKVPLVRPKIDFIGAILDIKSINSTGIQSNGEFNRKFETEIESLLSIKNVVAVSSATAALECAIAQVTELGDEILVADFSFPATANSVAWLGRRPVLVDSMEDNFGISISVAEKLTTKKTKALIAVDPFGMNCNFEEIRDFCAANKITFIEDAACALGSTYSGQPLGTFGDISCLSFHPRKLVSTGEGGAITFRDNGELHNLRNIKSHGAVPSELFFSFETIGTNARLSELSAAVGIRQLRKLPNEIIERKKRYEWYYEYLAGVDSINFPKLSAKLNWNYQSMVLTTKDNQSRNRIVSALRENGVSSTLATYAAHSQASFASYGYNPGSLPNSYHYQQTGLTVPIFGGMKKSTVSRISEIIVENCSS